jgi:hypothetical protein
MVIPDTIGPNRMGAPSSTRLPAGTLDAGRMRGRVIVASCSLVHFLTLESSNHRSIGALVKKSGGYIQYRRVESSLAIPSQVRSETDRITLESQFFANDIQ